MCKIHSGGKWSFVPVSVVEITSDSFVFFGSYVRE